MFKRHPAAKRFKGPEVENATIVLINVTQHYVRNSKITSYITKQVTVCK